MKKFWFPLVAAMLILVLLTAGCDGSAYIIGTGPVINKSYDLNNFTEIEISNAFQYDITRADNYGVTINCHENLVEHLDISQSAGRLYIRMNNGSYTNSEIKVSITLPALNKLIVSGASRGSAKGFTSSHSVEVTLSGASRLDANMETGELNLNLSGASEMTGSMLTAGAHFQVSGASHVSFRGSDSADCALDVSGASTLDIGDYKMINADISVSGASHATIYASGDLRVEATGASSVKYSGNPSVKALNVSGASKVSH